MHHTTYRRLGNEAVTDLVPLCQVHHDELHKQCRQAGKGGLVAFAKQAARVFGMTEEVIEERLIEHYRLRNRRKSNKQRESKAEIKDRKNREKRRRAMEKDRRFHERMCDRDR